MNIPQRWQNIHDNTDIIDLGDAKVGLQKWFSIGDDGLANIELVADVSRPAEQRAMFCMSVVTVDDDMKVQSYVPEGWVSGDRGQPKTEPRVEPKIEFKYGSGGTYRYNQYDPYAPTIRATGTRAG